MKRLHTLLGMQPFLYLFFVSVFARVRFLKNMEGSLYATDIK